MPKSQLPNEIFEDDESALHTFEQNREQLIRFHEQLASLGKENHIPQQAREEAQISIREFRSLKLSIDDEIKKLSKKKLKTGADLDLVIARLSIALYLYNRVEQMWSAVLERDSLAMYALFSSVRNEVKEVMAKDFFKKSSNEMIADYLRIEAVFVACSKVCGLPVLTISDAVKQYKGELRKEMIKAMTTGKINVGER